MDELTHREQRSQNCKDGRHVFPFATGPCLHCGVDIPTCGCGVRRDLTRDPRLMLRSSIKFHELEPEKLNPNSYGQHLRMCRECRAVYFPMGTAPPTKRCQSRAPVGDSVCILEDGHGGDHRTEMEGWR